nr:hypothetical protein [Saprospiraceae bacterium]
YEERWNVIHYIRSLQAATKKLEYSEKANTFNNIEVPYAVLASQKAAQTVVANAEVAVDTMMVKEVGGKVNQH